MSARTGNRQRLPKNALRVCASCETTRGNVRRGWEPITSGGEIKGYTCPACPAHDEPIRREVSGDRARFLAVVGTRGEDGRRRQLKRRFDLLEDARSWVEEVREGTASATSRGRSYSDPSRLTVRDLADRWLAHRQQEVGTPGGIREVTWNGYRSALHSLLSHLGDTPAREVTPGQIEGALRDLAVVGGSRERPLAHRSLVYGLGTLRQVFNHAVREGWVKSNPATVVKPPRQQHGGASKSTAAARRWTPEEVKRFRDHVDLYGDGERFAREPWIRAGMRLTLCGLRRSEVMGLSWEHIDLDAGTVEVVASRVTVGAGPRTVLGPVKVANAHRVVAVEAIHPGISAALRAMWLAQGRPATGLAVRDNLGRSVDPNTFSRRFRSLCRDAGVPVLSSVHNLRHSLATALEVAGVPEHQAAALLGHDVATYRRFYLVTDDDGAAAAAQVAGKLFAV